MNFKDFCKTDESKIKREKYDENELQGCKKESLNKENELKEKIDKYSSYSQKELLEEFLLKSQEAKSKGVYEEDNINSIKSSLFPYLSEEQKEKFNNLINMVK